MNVSTLILFFCALLGLLAALNAFSQEASSARGSAVIDAVMTVPALSDVDDEADSDNVKTATPTDAEPVTTPAPSGKQFKPSEEISEDKPVPFPVDI
mgnify:CR=1 FL=1